MDGMGGRDRRQSTLHAGGVTGKRHTRAHTRRRDQRHDPATSTTGDRWRQSHPTREPGEQLPCPAPTPVRVAEDNYGQVQRHRTVAAKGQPRLHAQARKERKQKQGRSETRDAQGRLAPDRCVRIVSGSEYTGGPHRSNGRQHRAVPDERDAVREPGHETTASG